jgi:lysophospholipase L1-like esterase
VLAERPDLVIWQLGTNALLRRDDLVADGELMQRGIAALKAAGSDVVLMDMQYAPRVLARPAHLLMQDMIATAADHGGVPLFRRFGMMRYWQEQPGAPKLVGEDGLHLNDAGYGCLAIALADALVANWSSHVKSVQIRPPDEPKEKSGLAVAGRTHAGTEH